MHSNAWKLALFLLAALVTASPAAGTPQIQDLYWIDFEGVPTGRPPTGSGAFPRDVLTGIVYGDPQVEAGPGGGQVLVLDPTGRSGQQEQVELALGLGGVAAGVRGYGLELDVFMDSLHSAEFAPSRFAVLLDDPSSRSVVLDGNGVIQQVSAAGWFEIGRFGLGEWIHLSLFAELGSGRWTIGVNGRTVGVGSFDGTDLTRARINLQVLGAGDRVLVDNIRGWAVVVPEPGTATLGLAAVVAFVRVRRKIRGLGYDQA